MPYVSDYLKQIEKALAAGDATEHTRRTALRRPVRVVRGRPSECVN